MVLSGDLPYCSYSGVALTCMGNAIGRGAAHPLPTVEDDEPDPVAERWPSSDDLQPSTPSFSDHYVMTDSVTAEENDGSSLSREASAGLGMLAQGLAVDWTATTMPACTPREMGMNRSLSFGEISSQLQNSASRSVSPSVLGRTRRRASFTPKVSQQTPPAATPPRTAQAAQGYGTPIHPRTPCGTLRRRVKPPAHFIKCKLVIMWMI